MREQRKADHLRLVQVLGDGPGRTGFNDIHFVHNCLPEVNPQEISIAASFCGKTFPVPLMINAITGGVKEGEIINRVLARAAREKGIPMAVGSQAAGFESEEARLTFQAAREENPGGFLLANLSAGSSPEKAVQAVEMICADALQLHLNIPQEVMMPPGEGDLILKGYLDNIRHIVRSVSVPVIVKEVGFGISREGAIRLLDTGIAAIDIGGKGGTNFIRVEGERYRPEDVEPFLNWGLPTAVSIVEVAEAAAAKVEIVACGGIRSGLDIARVLSLGAGMTGIAGPLVGCCYEGGEEAVIRYLSRLESQLRQVMLMLGARNIGELQQKPLVILGETGRWLELRGICPGRFALRGQ